MFGNARSGCSLMLVSARRARFRRARRMPADEGVHCRTRRSMDGVGVGGRGGGVVEEWWRELPRRDGKELRMRGKGHRPPTFRTPPADILHWHMCRAETETSTPRLFTLGELASTTAWSRAMSLTTSGRHGARLKRRRREINRQAVSIAAPRIECDLQFKSLLGTRT